MNFQTSGGKSGSTFMQTSDENFVIKGIKEEEYETFKLFGSDYLEHFDATDTCLNKAWGVYKVVGFGKTAYFLITDKIRIPDAVDISLYDLKGIEMRRKGLTSTTGLDVNFQKDMVRAGFLVSETEKRTLLNRVTNDTNFLKMHNIMDYSLVVAWDKRGGTIIYNIIDYLVPFSYLKKLEYTGK